MYKNANYYLRQIDQRRSGQKISIKQFKEESWPTRRNKTYTCVEQFKTKPGDRINPPFIDNFPLNLGKTLNVSGSQASHL